MKHLVDKQIKGEPLHSDICINTEFQVRARRTGRVVLIFADRQKAKDVAAERNLDCYAVTITTEKL